MTETTKKQKKAVVKKDMTTANDTPKDLRSKRQSGRPSNEERTSNESLKTNMRLLAADLLSDMRKNYKKFDEKNKISLLGMILKTLSLADDAERDETEITFEILAKKYLELKTTAAEAERATREATLSNPLNKQQNTATG